MCRVAVTSGGYRAAWVGYLQDDARKSVKLMACAGLDRVFFDELDVSWDDNERGGGVCGRAIRSGEIVIADSILAESGTEPWWDIMHRHGIESAIALPLVVGNTTIGIMAIYAAEQRAFAGKDLSLLDELAADLSFGIDTIRARAGHARTEAALHHLAMHDPGTGLPNQAMLRQWLHESLQLARGARFPVALLAINLPRMREIGDILGRHSIDQCLSRIAGAVKDAAGSDALVAREGRFTLAVALRKLDISGAVALAERLSAAVRQPFELGSCSMEVEARIGIAVFPGHASDPEALVGRASLAAQHALNTGRPHALLDANPEEAALKRLTMLGELRNAIENNELLIHYQPKVSATSQRITGAEALVRWKHPTRGMVPPGEFITIAEHTGLIIPLTYQVLRMVVQQLYAWRNEHGISIPVAVNLSAQNLHDPELSKHIDGLIGTWGIERRLLQLEITESTLMRDPFEALKALTGFSNSGMQLFIDDFGTGYSSLAYLASLPLHAVKIDRSFVNNMTKDTQHRAIVHSILSLASSLQMKVVAEGVETREQADMLCELSCDELQGYLFSRPLPPEQFIEWALHNR
jgi:diguanylate cyclase (GGDEF)-like protein